MGNLLWCTLHNILPLMHTAEVTVSLFISEIQCLLHDKIIKKNINITRNTSTIDECYCCGSRCAQYQLLCAMDIRDVLAKECC